MIEESWQLAVLEPSDDLDRRVRRRMRASAKGRASARRVAPVAIPSAPARGAARLLPLERAAYVILVAVYAVYAGARAVQVFQQAGASDWVPSVASSTGGASSPWSKTQT